MEDWFFASDIEAADRASRHPSPYGVELWQGDRCIGSYAGALAAAEPV